MTIHSHNITLLVYNLFIFDSFLLRMRQEECLTKLFRFDFFFTNFFFYFWKNVSHEFNIWTSTSGFLFFPWILLYQNIAFDCSCVKLFIMCTEFLDYKRWCACKLCGPITKDYVFVHTPTDRKKESTIIFVSSGRWNSLGLTSLLGLTALLLFCCSSRCNSSH